MAETNEKIMAVSNVLRPLRSLLAKGELSAPASLRNLLLEMSIEELKLLASQENLMRECARVSCLKADALVSELTDKMGLKVDGWNTDPDTGMEDTFYISTHHLEENRPSWAQNKTFSVGFYSETLAEFVQVARRLLMSRVRLSLWYSIVGMRIEHRGKKKAQVPGFYM